MSAQDAAYLAVIAVHTSSRSTCDESAPALRIYHEFVWEVEALQRYAWGLIRIHLGQNSF